jgi:hypothetical protein
MASMHVSQAVSLVPREFASQLPANCQTAAFRRYHSLSRQFFPGGLCANQVSLLQFSQDSTVALESSQSTRNNDMSQVLSSTCCSLNLSPPQCEQDNVFPEIV